MCLNPSGKRSLPLESDSVLGGLSQTGPFGFQLRVVPTPAFRALLLCFPINSVPVFKDVLIPAGMPVLGCDKPDTAVQMFIVVPPDKGCYPLP